MRANTTQIIIPETTAVQKPYLGSKYRTQIRYKTQIGVSRSNPLAYDVAAFKPASEYTVNRIKVVINGNNATNADNNPFFSLPKQVAITIIDPPKIK